MSNDKIANLLIIVLGVMLCILVILIFTFIFFKLRSNKKEKYKNEKEKKSDDKTKIQGLYNMQSIFKFMEFDKIEDNMIVQKDGKRYIMIIKCQGINYDLMSGVEKNSVEQGFIQYLNTLRYPIQIYVQTRTVDLTGSISEYKQKVQDLNNNLAQKEYEYNQKERSGQYSKAQLAKERYEVVKARNLYEYGLDIVNNTERMSLNRNILSKQYYVIISYYPEESNNDVYTKDEVRNIAFSELYTRAQSTISLLSVCGVTGKILDSMEIADLLYSAYNRDEAEMYDLKKAINSGFDNMYVTAPDVLDKRMEELDKQIEIDAIEKANEAIYKVRHMREKERIIKQKEAEFRDLVTKMADEILEENKNVLGDDIVEQARKEIFKKDKEEQKKEDLENKEENSNEQKKVKRAGRPRKTA